MPIFQPFQNGINSVRRELSAAALTAAGCPAERKTFLRPNENAGILPPKARPAGTAESRRVGPVPQALGAQAACEAALPFEEWSAATAAQPCEAPAASQGNKQRRQDVEAIATKPRAATATADKMAKDYRG